MFSKRRAHSDWVYEFGLCDDPHEEAEGDLRMYLENHEWDIAIGENDFGDLRSVFIVVLGREPVV